MFGRVAIRQLQPAELARMLGADDAPLVVDVRQPEELLADGAIPGAVNVPLGELDARLGEIPESGLVVLVCRSGHRSEHAARLLAGTGRTVANLHGGMLAWARG